MTGRHWLLWWFAIALLLRSGGAYGQEQVELSPRTRHTLAISAGVNDFHLKDEYLSPIIFSGRTFASEASFGGETGCHAYAIDLRFNVGPLNSGEQPRDVKQYLGYVSFSWLWRLGGCRSTGFPLDVRLGGGLSSFVMNTDFNTFGQTPMDIYYDQSWYWSHALDLDLSAIYRLSERRRFSFQLSAPLYRLVSRPSNGHHFSSRNKDVTQNFLNAALYGTGEFMWETLVFHGEVTYVEPLGESLGLRATYRFTYTSAEKPMSMAIYANQLLLGVQWSF